MNCWPFTCFKDPKSTLEAFEIENKMADHVAFAKRVRKSLYYGDYSDASLPSLSVTDVAVEALNNAVPPCQRILDRKYAHSVARRAKISPCALMMGMLYAERLRLRQSQCNKSLSSSDVFLISIMVASKYLYDEGEEEEVYNEDWAKAGFKTVQDINKLEKDFLKMMDWNLFISKEEFSNFVSQVESRVAITKGLSRGWLTYHDMSVVLGDPKLLKILLKFQHQLLKIISSCLAAYILGVSILLGSSTVATVDPTQCDVNQTTAHPTMNCLTTDSACLFSRNMIDMSLDESGYQPIAARRTRNNQRVQVQRWSNNSTNSTTSPRPTQNPFYMEHKNSFRVSFRKQMSNIENQSPVKGFDNPSVKNLTKIGVFTKLISMAVGARIDEKTLSEPLIQKTKSFSCVIPSNQSSFHKSLTFSYQNQGPCYG